MKCNPGISMQTPDRGTPPISPTPKLPLFSLPITPPVTHSPILTPEPRNSTLEFPQTTLYDPSASAASTPGLPPLPPSLPPSPLHQQPQDPARKGKASDATNLNNPPDAPPRNPTPTPSLPAYRPSPARFLVDSSLSHQTNNAQGTRCQSSVAHTCHIICPASKTEMRADCG